MKKNKCRLKNNPQSPELVVVRWFKMGDHPRVVPSRYYVGIHCIEYDGYSLAVLTDSYLIEHLDGFIQIMGNKDFHKIYEKV